MYCNSFHSCFPLFSKPNTSKFQFEQEQTDTFKVVRTLLRVGKRKNNNKLQKKNYQLQHLYKVYLCALSSKRIIGYWPCVLLRFHGPGRSRCQRKRKRKDAILTKQAWPMKDFLHGQENVFLAGPKREMCG